MPFKNLTCYFLLNQQNLKLHLHERIRQKRNGHINTTVRGADFGLTLDYKTILVIDYICSPRSQGKQGLCKSIDILRKYRLRKVCYVPTTSATFLAFHAAATNSTYETNKAGGTHH